MKIKIYGVIKKRVSQIVEVPFERILEISDILVKGNKVKKKFMEEIKKEFPKGSEINVEVLK